MLTAITCTKSSQGWMWKTLSASTKNLPAAFFCFVYIRAWSELLVRFWAYAYYCQQQASDCIVRFSVWHLETTSCSSIAQFYNTGRSVTHEERACMHALTYGCECLAVVQWARRWMTESRRHGVRRRNRLSRHTRICKRKKKRRKDYTGRHEDYTKYVHPLEAKVG